MRQFSTIISPGNYEWGVKITYVARKIGHKWSIEITSLDGDCPDNPSNLFWDIAQDRAEEHFFSSETENNESNEARLEKLEAWDERNKEIA